VTTSFTDPDHPVYKVGDRLVGIHDLLRRFADPAYVKDGIPRLSDLHLKVGETARYRLDGDLFKLEGGAPLDENVVRALLFPLLREDQAARLASGLTADVDAAYEWRETQQNFRINAFHDRNGLACAIRVLPTAVPPIERIGFPDDRTWRELATLGQGLVIVTGITGSGKSTTIASLIHHVNATRSLRIITLEDPIEYIIASKRSLISQRELGRHLPAFHDGLRSALREDPDIIFVGEIRDPETAALALTAAETGHLVLTTLHTRDAKGAITRLVDLFPPDRSRDLCSQISFALSHVIAQKLVARADGAGRRVAMEVLKNIPAVANQIRTGNWHQIHSTLETHSKDGLMTLERHLLTLVETGEITREEAARSANDPSILSRL
jgi:twitching motility protein PilT